MAKIAAMPRVSAIIIFLNEERFLGEAIASIRAQTFSDWEIILVDDGSTDRSSEIARSVADGDRIRYIEHPNHENRGMSASRNAGIAASRGEFISFLDADDVWVPEKLAEQLAIFDALPKTDMVYGRTLIWHEWNPDATTQDFCYDLGVTPDRLYPPTALLPILIRNRVQTPTSINPLMRRTLVDRAGGFEEQFRTMFEDQVFFIKTHLISNCYVDDRVWAKYRQHGASCCAQSEGKLHDLRARRTFLIWMTPYIVRARPRSLKIWWELVRTWLQLHKYLAETHLRRLLGIPK